ncbi:MAG: hypothetical protein ACYSTS_07590 [Planctomycetota bacterium]|jgi:hypothetical protein
MSDKYYCQNRKSATNNISYFDRIYFDALRRSKFSDNSMMMFCKQEEARMLQMRKMYFKRHNPITSFNNRANMGGLARVYGPGMSGLFPVTGAIASARWDLMTVDMFKAGSEFLKSIIRAARAFIKGLKAGLSRELTIGDIRSLTGKLGDSVILNAVLPVVFSSGAVAGIVKDVVEAVKGLIELAANIKEIPAKIKEIAKAVEALISEMLKDPSAAFELGKQVGSQLASEIKSLLNMNVFNFTYELGKIVGPFIVYTLLAFFGVPVGLGVKAAVWFEKLLMKYPKLSRFVKKIERLIPLKIKQRYVLYGKTTKSYIRQSGMPEDHFETFKDVANKQNVIVIVRNTNPRSLELIKTHKCPPKRKHLEKIATSSEPNNKSGIVKVVGKTKEKFDEVRKLGYAVVDDDLIPRDINGKVLELTDKFWKLEKGQVIDVADMKPVVGDYDLMGILDPDATGRNLSLVVSNKEAVEDVTSPIVSKFKHAVNAKLDRNRVLHGAQDQYGGFRGDATVIYPDGSATYLPTEEAVEAFYKSPNILRRTRTGDGASWPSQPKYEEGKFGKNVIPIRPDL